MIRAKAVVLVLSFFIASQGILFGQGAEEAIKGKTPQMEYYGSIEISAYSAWEGGGENYYTASGMSPEPWVTVATSSSIPFGTRLYIEDVGEVIVADRGGYLIESGQRIDLYIGEDDPEVWGLQTKDVYIIKEK